MTDSLFENWKKVERLGEGGQGTTWIVERVTDRYRAVLKEMKWANDEEARARVYHEVTNLILLNSACCKVPTVIEHNIHRLNERDIPLYFVAELIKGDTLADVVKSRKRLSLKQALAVTRDIGGIIGCAHAKNVQHRDLKPDNIMARDLEIGDMVLLDLGLSFNAESGEDLTGASEMLDNKFLSMPERRVRGGNRRDPRSDLTSVCAILYYCLTGIRPVDLQDDRGLPPHRRDGCGMQWVSDDKVLIDQLEVFLDRGFARHLDERFQTLDELFSRLDAALKATNEMTREDPLEVARQLSPVIRSGSRPTRVRDFKSVAAKAFQKVAEYINVNRNDGGWGVFQLIASFGGTEMIPKEYDLISERLFQVSVRVPGHVEGRVITYQIGSKGEQCVLLSKRAVQRDSNLTSEEWKEVFWYPGMEAMDESRAIDDFKQWLASAMREIAGAIDPSER